MRRSGWGLALGSGRSRGLAASSKWSACPLLRWRPLWRRYAEILTAPRDQERLPSTA
jgi:hypothetical protein